jgi:hypothetical protein
MTTAKPQTRTYSPREQNKRVVIGALTAHNVKALAMNVEGIQTPLYCSCRVVSPANAMSRDEANAHLAEKIVQAQNEWVRSL